MKKIIALISVFFLFFNAMAQDCDNENARRHSLIAEGMSEKVENVDDWQLIADEYLKAAQYAPDCPGIYYNLGFCYEKSGREHPEHCDKAIAYYQKYLQLSPNAANKSEVEDLIYKIEGNKIMYLREIQNKLAEERRLKEEQGNERIKSELIGAWRCLRLFYFDGKAADWGFDMGKFFITYNYDNIKVQYDVDGENRYMYGKLTNRTIHFDDGWFITLVSENEINYISPNKRGKWIFVRD